ncbi:Pre-rRNA-processing protein ESF2 [Xylariaceae sp. FL0016]|nr:Pre-rRNA-processing protein ESF2 [Xylariaceae sp. FL0016]
MAPEKRNHFLDGDESDEDGSQGYDSEAEELRKGGGRSSKRRKIHEDEALSDEDDALSEDDIAEYDEVLQEKGSSSEDKVEEEEVSNYDTSELPDVSRPLTKKNLVASEKAVRKSGVLYISRLPPFMKPAAVRKYFERFGKCNRIYLAPEDPKVHSRRVKSGGNKKKNFTEGWVEFVNKKHAKEAAELLNGSTVGGKKGSYYRDDIWSLIYLKGFKWNNLTEQIVSEAAERTDRMRAEISKSTKENKEFVRNIEKGKMLEGMQAKNAAKRNKDGENAEKSLSVAKNNTGKPSSARKFQQSSVGKKDTSKAPEEARRVISKLF